MLRRVFVALALVAALASPAAATIYTVCPSSCSTDCGGAQAVLTSMVTGDVLELQAGVTCSGLQLSFPTQTGLTVRGVPGGGSTLDGLGTTVSAVKVWVGATVSDLTIRGYTGFGILTIGGDRLMTVQDVVVTGGSSCIGAIGAGSTIQRVQCIGQSSKAIDKAGVAYTIRNCVVRGAGSDAVNATSATCEHVTVTGATGGLYALRCATTRWSIVANNAVSIAGIYTGTGTHENNLTWGNTPAQCSASCGTGSFTADPLFVSSTDLHLTATSPAIDAATGSTETYDVVGVLRGSARDIGAYEFVAPAPTGTAHWLDAGGHGHLLDGGAPGFLLYHGLK